MKKWFETLGIKTRQWMQGRYGADELTKALYILSLAFLILSLFSPLRLFYIPALALMLWSCIRCYSRNYTKRLQEREIYLRFTGKIRAWFHLQRDKWKDRKNFRYFRCKQCFAYKRMAVCQNSPPLPDPPNPFFHYSSQHP